MGNMRYSLEMRTVMIVRAREAYPEVDLHVYASYRIASHTTVNEMFSKVVYYRYSYFA